MFCLVLGIVLCASKGQSQPMGQNGLMGLTPNLSGIQFGGPSSDRIVVDGKVLDFIRVQTTQVSPYAAAYSRHVLQQAMQLMLNS